jgi:eukaryotic-like serine/threonine-protein kinase
VRTRSWKDDLTWLISGTVLQFALQRLSEWALAEQGTQELAATLVKYRLFLAREILAVLLFFLLVRIVRGLLDFRGIDLAGWLKSSALMLILAAAMPIVAHLDQILGLLASQLPPSVGDARAAIVKLALYGLFAQSLLYRWALDLVGVLLALLSIRGSSQEQPDLVAARQATSAGDHVRAGELYLKLGDVDEAKKAFRKGRAHSRVAALELRAGKAAEAASLYEKAGPAFAFEASRAWQTAGNAAAAAKALTVAAADARASFRWDRLAEAAELAGDNRTLEEACRRLAENQTVGPGRLSMFRRAGDAAVAWGNALGAAEAYRMANEPALAGDFYQKAGRPADAHREFERAGDLPKAAAAAAATGNQKAAHELRARDAEARSETERAAEEWLAAGLFDRAAAMFERAGQAGKAATAYRDAGRPDRAAPLFQRSGDLQNAAAAWEASGQAERAAQLYRHVGRLDKAAALYQAVGRLAEAAATLEQSGAFLEAIPLYVRAGRKLDAARCALLSGHRDLAWENLMSVPRNEAGAPEFFLELAEAHLRVDEASDAVHILRELLGPAAVEKTTFALHEALARALEANGDLAGAADRLGRIAAIDPAYAGAAERQAALALRVQEEQRLAPVETAAPFSVPPASLSSSGPLQKLQASMATPAVATAGFGSGASGPLATFSDPSVRYEIVSELGRGGMGIVHKALDRKLDRFVALKILPSALWGDDVAMRYFEREAKAIAGLEHPNVVALYDFGHGFGSAYLAMEYLDGPNLQKVLKGEPARVREHWREWFIQASRGVAAAHAKGILHRDLKPANLMLDRHGTLRILDFGLARPVGDSGMTSKLIGTPAFLPPEVLRGESPSPASDVYSLGATFYTLATGRWPYVGDDVLVARLERDPDDPRPYAPFLTEDEATILMKALSRFRPERYPDAGELLGALLSLEG